jgi:hypothetical protein
MGSRQAADCQVLESQAEEESPLGQLANIGVALNAGAFLLSAFDFACT